jgi:hypothetical protein
MTKITLFKPNGDSQEFQTEKWSTKDGVLAFYPTAPGNTGIRTTLPFVIEFEDIQSEELE